MKFEFHKIAAVAALVFFVGAAAFAQGYTGPGAGKGTGAAAQITTAAQVKTAADNATVSLEGFVVKALGDDSFQFQDASGTVTVEIDDKIVRTMTFNDKTKVRLYGEVDANRRGNDVDVHRAEIVQ